MARARASFRLRYDPAQFAHLTRKIDAMHERAQDVSPAWNALLSWFADQEFQQWLTRGQRWRTPWAALAPRTLAEKFRKGFPLDPLIRTGAMVSTLVRRPLAYENITPTSVSAGTTDRKAGFHQRGTKHMPARPMISGKQIRREQAATSAVANWIIRGEQKVSPREEIRGPR